MTMYQVLGIFEDKFLKKHFDLYIQKFQFFSLQKLTTYEEAIQKVLKNMKSCFTYFKISVKLTT